MKKLLAILLSALMLCAMIPFGTVAAAEGDPIVQLSIVDELESVDAGNEFQVEVYFMNLEDTVGLIGALVEIGFDSDAFELVTYFDEDEEAWMPPIEVGSKYNASSNKYIMFSPIDEETGAMERCLVKYMRATATTNQVRREDHFFTVTFKVKDDAVSGTYDLTAIQYDGLFHGNVEFKFVTENTSIVVNGTEPPAGCEHEYFYACDKVCALCGEETRPEAEHTIAHKDAVEPTCTEFGNIEYWYCSDCGTCWDNPEGTGMPLNQMSVKLAPSCKYGAEHVAAKEATCTENGNVEYWYCANCDMFYADADCTVVTNYLSTQIAASCKYSAVAHEAVEAGCHYTGNTAYWYCANCDVYYADAECTIVTNYLSTIIPALQDTATYAPAKTPTCTENGNVEYWYCDICGQVWADEALTQLTNHMNVIRGASCKYGAVYTAAKEATCAEYGNAEYWYCANCDVFYADADCTVITNYLNVRLPKIDHTYTNAHDVDCNECGEIRDLVLPATKIILNTGNSITEEIGGLAFKFDVAADGIVIGEDYVADYTNATVTIDGVEYKLVKMGAIANNKGLSNQTLADVTGHHVLDIPAEKVFGDYSYAIRITNIPEEHLDTEITVCSYYTYECEGELITVYGEDWTTSYNAELNG